GCEQELWHKVVYRSCSTSPSSRRPSAPRFCSTRESRRCRVAVGGAWGEGPGSVGQGGQLWVQVVGEPRGDAEVGVQAQGLPGAPECLESGQCFGVLSPLGAPADLAAYGAGEDDGEVVLHPGVQTPVGELGYLIQALAAVVSGRGDGAGEVG